MAAGVQVGRDKGEREEERRERESRGERRGERSEEERREKERGGRKGKRKKGGKRKEGREKRKEAPERGKEKERGGRRGEKKGQRRKKGNGGERESKREKEGGEREGTTDGGTYIQRSIPNILIVQLQVSCEQAHKHIQKDIPQHNGPLLLPLIATATTKHNLLSGCGLVIGLGGAFIVLVKVDGVLVHALVAGESGGQQLADSVRRGENGRMANTSCQQWTDTLRMSGEEGYTEISACAVSSV